ncbi:MAG: MBOAT family protein [Candidatus Azobacteroides sp.]|nr:MBOAT family protein [Candidatus Azobacteroides sp.]
MIYFLKNIFAFDSHSPLLFTQFYFWVFFAGIFAGFACLQNKILLRNAYLCFVSLFFYYKTSGLSVLILIFTTVVNFYLAQIIFKSNAEWKKKTLLTAGLIVNLFFLCYFKYAYFFIDLVNNIFGLHLQVFDSFAQLGNWFCGEGRFNVSTILLPAGISFYIFQNISYLMDIFRSRVPPVKELLNYGFFVSFFPKLITGPIVRSDEFIPQLYKKYYLGQKEFGLAVFWIMNGLAKKIILSDYLAVNFIDRIFENPTMFSGFENLVALFAYSLQIYADFSGYTDIAIGVALLMGFHLPKNFNSPYKASNPGDFWKRWHITLSQWLQNYLYIPLGGNRRATFATYFLIVSIGLVAVILSGSMWMGLVLLIIAGTLCFLARAYPSQKKKINTNLNLMNTMLIGGLWHGASWNFMIWGGLNGLGIVVFKFWKDWNRYTRTLILLLLTLLSALLYILFPLPLFNILRIWLALLLLGAYIRMLYKMRGGKRPFQFIENAWAILQTFVFVSFTRLFFRSGSNLNPAEANQTAWNTAQQIVNQIGGSWDFNAIGRMIHEYRSVFFLIIIGMLIHWLPENFKRRYRLSFALMPPAVMFLAAVLAVFIIYQFITADLQTFIYFQF